MSIPIVKVAADTNLCQQNNYQNLIYDSRDIKHPFQIWNFCIWKKKHYEWQLRCCEENTWYTEKKLHEVNCIDKHCRAEKYLTLFLWKSSCLYWYNPWTLRLLWKKDKDSVKLFSTSPTMFSIMSKTDIIVWSTSNLLSANPFNLVESRM